MARTKKLDKMDGAHYWQNGKTPDDYMNDEKGMRPGETKAPNGVMFTDLTGTWAHAPLPPRSIWKTGEYKGEGKWTNQDDKDYRTWVITGEGTPGNFVTREYLLPTDIALDLTPKHPADWPKKKAITSTTKTSSAPALPFGIRFRCPSCGHWYKENDLANHSQVCPSKEGGESDWAIACECCTSLDETSKCKDGFPRQKPEKKEVEDGGGAPAS